MKHWLNKSILTYFVALLFIVAAYWSPHYADLLKSVGFFALSGAVTNGLAVHMLFEKIPFVYGSGVIPNRFEEFKVSIKNLMMEQFFTVEQIEQLIESEERQGRRVLNMEPVLNAVDYDRIFLGLVTAIKESSFGAMLAMMGGEEALQPLKTPVTRKLRSTLNELAQSERFHAALRQSLDTHKIGLDMTVRIETVVDQRLSELTPQLVKQIVQTIIRRHLGWLVVWGGVFGGALGAAFSLL